MREILIIAFALAAAAFDIRTRRISNKLVLCMLAVWLLLMGYEVLFNTDTAFAQILDGLFGLCVGGGIFLAVYLISRKGLGGGDVKFICAAGLYLGLAGIIPAILYTGILAALTGGILILAKKITRKDKVPLAPFLLAGIAITVILK